MLLLTAYSYEKWVTVVVWPPAFPTAQTLGLMAMIGLVLVVKVAVVMVPQIWVLVVVLG